MTEINEKTVDVIPGYEFLNEASDPMQWKWTIIPTVPAPEFAKDNYDVDLKTVKNEFHPEINSAMTKTEAIEVLSKVAKSTSCLGTNVAESIAEADLELNSSTSYYYQLSSVVERRIFKYIDKPFKEGDTVDGPDCGTPPQVWEIEVPVKYPENKKYETTVPHSSVVKVCAKCKEAGHVECEYCKIFEGHCPLCGGCGFNECDTCKWEGKVVRSIEFKVKWELVDNHVICQDTNVAEVPENLLREAAGDTVREIRGTQMHAKEPRQTAASSIEWLSKINKQGKKQNRKEEEAEELQDPEKRIGLIPPMTDLPNDFLNNKSQVFSKKHIMCDGLVIRQKQILRAIPVTRCDYLWRGRRRHFVIYGNNKKVLMEKRSADSCQIL